MEDVRYHLFRVKMILPDQGLLFDERMTPSDLFYKALSEKPSMSVYEYTVWHIGNLTQINSQTGSFAIGKTTKTTAEKYDANTGNFVEEEDERAPFTTVYYERTIGILAIAKKSRVAPTVAAIARKIEKLLAGTETVRALDTEVFVDAIRDPIDFIAHLHSAYSIRSFRATFTGPNPVDADTLFQKPLSVYCQAMNAREGLVEVKGGDIDEVTAAVVARSTAATGNDASARIIERVDARPVTIRLGGNDATVSAPENAPPEEVIDAVVRRYRSIQENEDNSDFLR